MTIFIAVACFIAGAFWGVMLMALLAANNWGD